MTGMAIYDKPGGWPTVHWWEGPGNRVTACGASVEGMRMHVWWDGPSKVPMPIEVRCAECMAWKRINNQ